MKNVLRILTLSGAFLAFLIGSGIATGQEIMQYYSPYGYAMLGTSVITVIILAIANYGFAWAGKHGNIEKGSDVFAFYCGPVAGKAFDFFTVLFCYMSYVVMVGGGAATLHQQYAMPLAVGGIAIAVLAVCTVVFGLNNIVNIIGFIAPTFVMFFFFICLFSLSENYSSIENGIKAVEDGTVQVTKAGTNWFTSGLSYGGFCILWLASFTAALGMKEDFKTLMKASVLSAVAMVIVNMVIAFAILSQIHTLSVTQIPNLIIAEKVWEPIAYVFGFLIFVAIYTTACPLLWTASARFTKEGTVGFKMVTVLLGALGVGVALFIPFNILMNYIYTINGYLGFIVLLFMCVRMFKVIRKTP